MKKSTIDCDLHLHTNHSFDCESPVAEVLRWAETKELDVIAVTDHDLVTAYLEAQSIESKVRVIPGVEVTTKLGTHLLGYFITEPIISKDILDVIDEIHDRGGICSLPHPYRSDTGLIYNQEIKNLYTSDEVAQIIEAVDLIEGLNAKCSDSDRNKTEQFKTKYAHKIHTAGSDAHQPYEVGRARLRLTVANADATTMTDDELKIALLNNQREIIRETIQELGSAETLTLSVIEGARKTLELSKSLIPTGVWHRMRSVYMRSTGAVKVNNELKSLQSNRKSKEKVL